MNSGIRSAWLSCLLSTEPADRPRAEAALRDFYVAAHLPPPAFFFWFDSPLQAAWAVAVLNAPHDNETSYEGYGLGAAKPGREIVETARTALCQNARQDWDGLISVTGELLRLNYTCIASRARLHDKNRKVILRTDRKDPLWLAENSFRTVLGRQENRPRVPYIEYPVQQSYSCYLMAMDESAALERDAPPLLVAAWTVARNAGYWWGLRGAVVLAKRPFDTRVNHKAFLHSETGPAAVLRDGSSLWAWNGMPVLEEWILHPESVPSSGLRRPSPAFQKLVAARVGAPARKPKPSAILKQELPAASEKRVRLLQRHNQGRLPFFDRYGAGNCREVWADLIALGPSVRQDPHAADALAVAYETMRRVRQNVRTVTARLKALDYEKERGRLHSPPTAKSRAQIPRLEKAVGGLPLSLRAFYDLVGAVDWTGHHPVIAPRDNAVQPDPLVVEPIETALACFEDGDDDGHIMIGPGEAINAGIGSDGLYLIELPNVGADGKVVNERHDVYFVEYLRIAFRSGGFPGYDGVRRHPRELASLVQGLLEF